MKPSALVLLSGGMDSTVLLYYVMDVLEYTKVEAILFDYGQWHRIELDYALKLVDDLNICYDVIKVDLTQFGRNFLTRTVDGKIIRETEGLTVVVPARNSIFLSMATAYAETRDLQDIFIGANGEDFKDFPDCRPYFINLMGHALAIGNNIRGVYAPFVHKSKQEIVEIGRLLGVDFSLTWSCYDPILGQGNDPKPCGKCHACIERNKVL